MVFATKPLPPAPNKCPPAEATLRFGKDGCDPGVEDGKLGTFGMPVMVGDIIEARNGFDAPPPVIWGLSPWPNVEPVGLKLPKPPVACELSALRFVCWGAAPRGPTDAEYGVVGEAGLDWVLLVDAGALSGIGGKDSNNAAPNDEVGLNGFKPANPVV